MKTTSIKEKLPEKPCKTLLDFFKSSSSASSSMNSTPTANCSSQEVIKVHCPGCDELVSQARINFHLDYDCTSKKINSKRNSRKTKVTSRKSGNVAKKLPNGNKRECNNTLKNKQMALLSDDSDDDFVTNGCESPVLFDLPDDVDTKSDVSESNDGSFFIRASMVETQLIEEDNIIRNDCSSSNNLTIVSSSAILVKSMLEDDWNFDDEDSNDITTSENVPTKRKTFDLKYCVEAKPDPLELDEKCNFSNSCNVSEPNNLIKIDVSKPEILTHDSPQTSSKVNDESMHIDKDYHNTSNFCDVNDDFKSSQMFRTPIRQSRSNSKSKSKSPKCSPPKGSNVSPMKNISISNSASSSSQCAITNHVNTVTYLSSFEELPDVELDKDSNSSSLYSPLCSPVVCCQRTPSPSPTKLSSSQKQIQHKLKCNYDNLFTGTQKEESINLSKTKKTLHSLSPDASPIKNNIIYSPAIRRNMARFGLSPKISPSNSKYSTVPPLQKKSNSSCISKPDACRNIFNEISATCSNLLQSCVTDFTPSQCVSQIPSKLPNLDMDQPTSIIAIKTPIKSNHGTPIKSPRKKNPEQYRDSTGYYLDNFLSIVDAVCTNPADYKLFNEDDQGIIDMFHGFSLPAKKLYVRLFQRNLKWKRVDRLDYLDICDKEDIILYIKELSYGKYLQLGEECFFYKLFYLCHIFN